MKKLQWWMRCVGVFYLLLFIAVVFLHKPIQVEGPRGTLELAADGDALANFVIDTWFTLGMGLFTLGIALLIASRNPGKATALVWTILLWEFLRGICVDLYKISRGTYPTMEMVVWIVIHGVIILLGLLALKASQRTGSAQGVQ